MFIGKICDRYACESMKLKTALSAVTAVSLTTDLWTSAVRDAYLGLTIHFVVDSTLQSYLPDCIELPGNEHKVFQIAALIKDRLEFWGISDKAIACTSDNWLNMTNAVMEHLKFPYIIRCLSHTVHFTVEKGKKQGRISPLMAKARKARRTHQQKWEIDFSSKQGPDGWRQGFRRSS